MTGHLAITVHEMSQTGEARRRAAALAERLGFDAEESGRVGLVVTEASDEPHEARAWGEIVLSPSGVDEARAVEILAMDRGPGIDDLERALGDGYSSAGSMGGGLGAIRRNAEVFDLYSSAAGTILARVAGGDRTRAARRAADAVPAIEIGAVCIPYPGETVSGDAWAVADSGRRTLLLVADGLGHGVGAHEAAALATRVFAKHAGEPPAEVMARLHGALRPTRGAAAAVLELDPAQRAARFAGVGNISGSIHAEGVPARWSRIMGSSDTPAAGSRNSPTPGRRAPSPCSIPTASGRTGTWRATPASPAAIRP